MLPKQWKNGALLLASLVFYAWGEPSYVVLMIAMILWGYGCALQIERHREQKIGCAWLVISVAICITALITSKYMDFIARGVHRLTGLGLPVLGLALPIGISFYTFQLISYLVDVFRGTVHANRSLIDLALYVTMFPQLIAGPIVRYTDIEKQLRERKASTEKLCAGAQRFVIGLGKKTLIADALGELCVTFRASDEKSVLFFWIYAVSFTLQIYFDFSGYSDMAIGLGKLFGFEFIENFRYPYVSRSITEFWRRWHISLGNWFRDYVYIPLGGNRVSKGNWYRNLFLVWALTGLWHGAAMNFLLWGLFFAALLIAEKHWLLKRLESARFWNHGYVMFFVIISFVIFNGADLTQILGDLGGMFGRNGVPLVSAESIYYLKSYAVTLLAAIVGATPAVKCSAEAFAKTQIGRQIWPFCRVLGAAAILLIVTAYLIDGSFQPFLYFRF